MNQPLDQEEKDRLSQLGKDRRLAEAVDALDLATAEFVRVAGNENSEEALVSQAASNYRKAVERRNEAFDKAGGVTASGSISAAPVDPEELQKLVADAVDAAPGLTEERVQEMIDGALAKLKDSAKADAKGPAPASATKAPAKAPADKGSESAGNSVSKGGGAS
jgi:hypothetical protein